MHKKMLSALLSTLLIPALQVTGNDGASAADWQITGSLTVNLRSDRSGKAKNGRVYTLTLECSDDAGMTSTKTVNVTVPHDQGKK